MLLDCENLAKNITLTSALILTFFLLRKHGLCPVPGLVSDKNNVFISRYRFKVQHKLYLLTI